MSLDDLSLATRIKPQYLVGAGGDAAGGAAVARRSSSAMCAPAPACSGSTPSRPPSSVTSARRRTGRRRWRARAASTHARRDPRVPHLRDPRRSDRGPGASWSGTSPSGSAISGRPHRRARGAVAGVRAAVLHRRPGRARRARRAAAAAGGGDDARALRHAGPATPARASAARRRPRRRCRRLGTPFQAKGAVYGASAGRGAHHPRGAPSRRRWSSTAPTARSTSPASWRPARPMPRRRSTASASRCPIRRSSTSMSIGVLEGPAAGPDDVVLQPSARRRRRGRPAVDESFARRRAWGRRRGWPI